MQGIRLASGKLERFLILRVESGSLPVPYDRIIVSNPEHAERVRDETDEPEGEPPTGGGSPSKKEKKVHEINGGEPPAPGPRATIRLPSAERFRDTPVIERQNQRVPSARRSPGQKPAPIQSAWYSPARWGPQAAHPPSSPAEASMGTAA